MVNHLLKTSAVILSAYFIPKRLGRLKTGLTGFAKTIRLLNPAPIYGIIRIHLKRPVNLLLPMATQSIITATNVFTRPTYSYSIPAMPGIHTRNFQTASSSQSLFRVVFHRKTEHEPFCLTRPWQ